jgi:hypothetical protein
MPWASSQGEAFTNTFLCSVILPLKCNLQLSSLLSTTEIKCAMCCMMMHRQGICSLTYKLLNRWSRVVHALSDQQASCLERRRDLNSKPCGGHMVACSCPVQPSKRRGIQNKHFIVLARNGPHHDKSKLHSGVLLLLTTPYSALIPSERRLLNSCNMQARLTLAQVKL